MNKLILTTACAAAAIGLTACDNRADENLANATANAEDFNTVENVTADENFADMNMDNMANETDNAADNASTNNSTGY